MSKPRLLFISQNLPKRFASSGVMRLYHMVRLLQRDFDVVVATYFMPAFDKKQDITALEDLGVRVEAVPFDYPAEGSDRFSLKLPSHVKTLLDEEPYDVIHLERFWMALCLEHIWDKLGIPVVLDEMDVEYKREFRRIEHEGGGKEAWSRWAKEKEQELAVCARADHVIAVTEADKMTLLAELPSISVTVIPTGQDVSWLRDPAAKSLPSQKTKAVFCGDYRHVPNVDAALMLGRELWPLIREAKPDATLTLLGSSPPEELLKLDGLDGIEVPGWIDDLRPWYGSAKVALAPIRFGSGIKAKIIEAMACGLPVVTTSIGAEGLPFENGVSIFVEDDPMRFVEKTVTLLNDEMLHASVVEAMAGGVAQYDWEALYHPLQNIYLSLLPGVRS